MYVCDKEKGVMKQRHDIVRNALCRMFNDLGTFTSIEPVLQYNDIDSHQPMRADLCVVTHAGTYYIDIGVVCPSGQEYVMQHGSDRTALKSCTVYSADKCHKYRGKLPGNCTDDMFIPIVMESYGGINERGDQFIRSLCNQYSDHPSIDYDHMMNVLSSTLQMGNGMIACHGIIQQQAHTAYTQQSQRMYRQNHSMFLLSQYVDGAINIDWSAEVRPRHHESGSLPGANQVG